MTIPTRVRLPKTGKYTHDDHKGKHTDHVPLSVAWRNVQTRRQP